MTHIYPHMSNPIPSHLFCVRLARPMEKQTLALLDSALEGLRNDLSPRAAELAEKSTLGTLSTSEHTEYAEIVRINDTLSLLKLQAEELSSQRVAS